jgi:hypothetical protein
MVFHADAKRDRAVNRFARWTDVVSTRGPELPGPVGRFAAARLRAAERAVQRAAARDVLGGVDTDHVGFRIPADSHRAACTFDAVAYYRACVIDLAGYLDDAAGRGRAAAGEGVPGPRQAREVRRRLWG